VLEGLPSFSTIAGQRTPRPNGIVFLLRFTEGIHRVTDTVRRAEQPGRLSEDPMRPDVELVIPILRVNDAAKAVAWYHRLGFTEESVHRFAPGMPAFVTIARGRMRLFLSEHEGDARPDTLIYLRVRDVEAIAAEFGVTIEQAPWAREIELRDLDGNRLRIGTPT
jgi:catechol 2,3-dioxygenase-like lactoylglutathione lyase family enzyme